MLLPVLARASLRQLTRHPWQLVFSIVGVALGVAVVVSVDLAAASAQRAFDLSYEAVAGRATHQVVGDATGLPEALYRRLRLEAGVRRSAPVIEQHVRALPTEGPPRTLRLLGVDPFAEAPFRPWLARDRGEVRLDLFLTRPGALLLAAATAADLGLAPGDRLAVEVGAEVRELELIGVLDPADELSRRALADLAVVDVATAQEVAGWFGRLSRIDLILEGGEVPAAVEALLPPAARVVPAAARSRAAEGMTRAFRLNLRALSLLALLCGAFLIYNAMVFSVVERRPIVGVLRTVGVTRRQVFALVLFEAAALGAVGSAVGLAAGSLLGHGLVELVARTINDLYFRVSVESVTLAPASLARGLALGLGATVAAAVGPAREATAAPPRATLLRSELEAGSRRAAPRLAAAAALLLAADGALLALSGSSLAGSFAGLFAVLVGCALATPLATLSASRLLRPAAARLGGLVGRLAAGDLGAHLSRTGVAVAALMMAVAVTVAVGLMISSFRSTVERWLALSLPADLYVSLPAGPGVRLLDDRASLDPELADALARLPGVARVNRVLRTTVAESGERTALVALAIDERSHGAFDLAEGDPERAWPAFHAGRAVLVSEPFSLGRGRGVGDEVRLATPGGEIALPIAGVYHDYASESGTVALDYGRWLEEWGDERLSGLAVFVADGARRPRVAEAVRRVLAERGERLDVRSSGAIREQSLVVFDRTFLITGVLRLLAVAVAFVGVLSALTALGLERSRELGVLRALGLTRRQLWALVTAQTGLLGLVAGLLALPVGIAMAAMMIYVINRRSFGWTMPLELSLAPLAGAVALAVGAAVVAGLYPAWRMSRTEAAEALRAE